MLPWFSHWSARARLACAVFLLVASAGVARARLGETEEQLVQRLGTIELRQAEQVVEQQQSFVVGETLHFVAGGFTVVALMIDGHCERITYVRTGDWADENFSTLLAANRAGGNWQEIRNRKPKDKRSWRRDDGVLASWMPLTGFTISSPAYEKARASIREAAKRTSAKLASS